MTHPTSAPPSSSSSSSSSSPPPTVADASTPHAEAPNFAETTLRMAGKSEEESRRTGNLDRADDQTEKLFQQRYQTAQSPLHRAVWDVQVPLELFTAARAPGAVATDDAGNPATATIERSLSLVRDAVRSGRLLGGDGKLSSDVVDQLSSAGYWGLLVPREYGGAGASFQQFAAMLRQMATWSATAAGWGSVHGCIGAIDPLVTFGAAGQRVEFLPRLASGAALSAFALTEPWAGSDLTALRTRAERDGDGFRLFGEKLFITNAGPGRVIGLVALLDKQPAVFVCELPREESEEFRFRRYELHALKHSHNCGLIFNGLRIPGSSLLESKQGNGLTIAYHGLNRGRVAVCATAAGQLRSLLAGMLAWSGKRTTYGQPIAKRELVTRRIGRMAALIVGCDALSDWCASLLDQGYRGELECIVAKVFGSEALKEGAIDLALKTHGGRAFVRGHACGDNMHDYLAPTIYEGEGDLLGLALFKGLVKQHATTYFEPLMKAMRQAGLKAPPRWNPLHWWKLRAAAWPYGKWILSRRRPQGIQLPKSLAVAETGARFSPLVEFATREFTATGLQIDRALRRHQLRLADRQCRMSELAKRVQRLTTMLCVTLYGAAQTNALASAAALALGNDLQRELTGRPVSDAELRATVELGQSVLRDPSALLADCPPASIVMPYDAESSHSATR